MQQDARITLYGGVPIGFGVVAVGVACGCHVLSATGFALVGAALLVALTFDAVYSAGEGL